MGVDLLAFAMAWMSGDGCSTVLRQAPRRPSGFGRRALTTKDRMRGQHLAEDVRMVVERSGTPAWPKRTTSTSDRRTRSHKSLRDAGSPGRRRCEATRPA